MVGYMPIIYVLAIIGGFMVCVFTIKLLFEPFEKMEEEDTMSGLVLSIEDLKKIRDGYGYKLVKKPVKQPIKPCKCGYLKPKKVVTHDGLCYICPNCHRRGDDGKTPKERKENWNKMV